MKKITSIFLLLAATLFFSDYTLAQDKPTVKIASIKKDGKNVDVALVSSKKFIAGGNIYILYIGDKEFRFSNHQYALKGKGNITFLVPENDFNALPEGANTYLSYGHLKPGSDEERQAMVKESPRCWYLGKFSKKL